MAGRIIIVLFAFCLLNFNTSGQDKDSIILYNTQILIGEVQQGNLGSLIMDEIDLKIINIKFFKIRRLIIRERFKIETIDKKIIYGTLKTTNKDGWVSIHQVDGTDFEIQITHIYQLISMNNNFVKRLIGEVSSGFTFTKSSNIGQFNFSGTVQYTTKKNFYELSATTIASIDSTGYSRDNENIQLFTTHDFSSTWFRTASVLYQRNLELSISRRLLVMGGVGNKLFIKQKWRLLGISGISFSEEKSTAGVSSNILYEIPVTLLFNFYQFHNPDIQISSSQTVYISLSQSGRIRYDGNSSISWQLIRYFYLKINPYINYDSEPPSGASSNFDYGMVIGISYKF